MDLKDKICVITGGASGLGLATAEHFLDHGAKVVLFDVNAAAGNGVVAKYGSDRVVFHDVDVTDESSVRTALQSVVTTLGAVHVCINCAGIGHPHRIVGKNGVFPKDQFERVVAVNLVGTFNVMRLCAEIMSRQEPVSDEGERGVIINTASIAAFEGQIGQIAYSASKAGVVGMTLPAARDLASFGIRVLAIAPGIFDTPMLGRLPPENREKLSSGVPFPKRLGKSTDFAWLAKDIVHNPYLNGEVIRIDGAIRMEPR